MAEDDVLQRGPADAHELGDLDVHVGALVVEGAPIPMCVRRRQHLPRQMSMEGRTNEVPDMSSQTQTGLLQWFL